MISLPLPLLFRLTGKYIDLTAELEAGQFEAARKQLEDDERSRAEAAKRKPSAAVLVLSDSDDEGGRTTRRWTPSGA